PRTPLFRRQFSIYTIQPGRDGLFAKGKRASAPISTHISETSARRLPPSKATGLHFSFRKLFRLRVNGCVPNWKKCFRACVGAFTLALAKKILAATNDAGLSAVAGSLQIPADGATFDEQWLGGVANDLLAKPSASLVLAGANQPVAVQLLVYSINGALKNLGQ